MGKNIIKSGAILRTLFLIGIASVLCLTACSEKIVNDSADTIAITTSFKPGNSSALTGYTLTVSAADMRTISTTLIYRDGYLVGQASVRPGKNRRFTIEALDETGRVIYRGEHITDVLRGQPIELSITLLPVTPSLTITPHMTTATMGTDVAFNIYAWNIPDLYDISFLMRINDTEDLMLYDSIKIGDNLIGSPTVMISEGTDSVFASLGRLDAVQAFVDSAGNGHLLQLFFHSHYDTPLNVDTISLELAVRSMAFDQASNLTADSIFVDLATVILSKDSPTGDTTAYPGWVHIYEKTGADWGNAVAIAQNGNIITSGQYSVSGTNWNAAALAVDSNGNYINDASIGAAGIDKGTDIISIDNSFRMSGWMTSTAGDEDAFLAELDNSGSMQRQIEFRLPGDQRANAIVHSRSNNLYLVGRNGSEKSDVLIIKTDAMGDTIWTNTYDFDSYDEAFGAVETSNGNIFVVGATGMYVNDILAMRINSDGALIWDTTLGGSRLDWAGAVAITPDDGFLLCGYTYSMGAGAGDTYLAKFSAEGDFLWQTTLGSPGHEHGNDIIATSDGNFIIAGLAGSVSSGKSSATITKVSQAGQVIWQRSFAGGTNNEAFGVAETAGGSYIVTGSTESSATNDFDTFILKMNSEGNWQ